MTTQDGHYPIRGVKVAIATNVDRLNRSIVKIVYRGRGKTGFRKYCGWNARESVRRSYSVRTTTRQSGWSAMHAGGWA